MKPITSIEEFERVYLPEYHARRSKLTEVERLREDLEKAIKAEHWEKEFEKYKTK